MSFEVTGTLYKNMDTVQVKDTFRKREFVLEVENGAYTDLIKFQLIQDRCDSLDGVKEGTALKVYFDLKGREWTGRDGKVSYFTNLQAWKVEVNQPAPPAASGGEAFGAGDFPTAADAPPMEDSDDDDFPF